MPAQVDWSAPVPDAEAWRRAGGRRRYNALRRQQALVRRVQVLSRLVEMGNVWGARAAIARELGVSPSTVSRDIAVALELGQVRLCPCCGRPIAGRPKP